MKRALGLEEALGVDEVEDEGEGVALAQGEVEREAASECVPE